MKKGDKLQLKGEPCVDEERIVLTGYKHPETKVNMVTFGYYVNKVFKGILTEAVDAYELVPPPPIGIGSKVAKIGDYYQETFFVRGLLDIGGKEPWYAISRYSTGDSVPSLVRLTQLRHKR